MSTRTAPSLRAKTTPDATAPRSSRRNSHFPLFLILRLLPILLPASRAAGQFPCPPAPTSYPYNNGQLTAIEGPVTPAVVEPANYPPCDQSPGTLKPGAADLAQGWKRGQHASLAITASGGTDGARFIVVWDTDMTADPLGSNNNYRSILSARFDATGQCVPWPAPNQNYGIRELSQNTGDTWSNNFGKSTVSG